MFRVPMIFPGQASQVVGMARDLAERPGRAAEFLGSVDQVLGYELTAVMWQGPLERLTETRHAQPAILAHSVAATLALRERGVEPSIVAGHSLGEFSAAVAAGALAAEEALRLVRRRGELMFTAGRERPGTMAAVLGLAAERVSAICAEVARTSGVVVLANHNSLAQVVISGEVAAVAAAGEALKSAGAKKVVPLQVSGAFHSPLLAAAGRGFAAELQKVTIRDPRVPLVANVSARAQTTAAALREGFARQLTSPVLWHESLEAIVAGAAGEEPRAVLEVGPGRVLAGLARRAHPDVSFLGAGTLAELDKMVDSLRELLT
jgi:[acyl-carrier-protein] S-malonyltransferase